MLGKVFGVICILSFIGSMVTGDPVALGNAVLDGASDTVTLTLTLCGMMGLWCGIMRVLESAGLIRRLARMMRPLLRFFFPAASEDEEACGAIAANISANLLGLGNAATPSGMEAVRRMEEEQEQNPQVRHALYMLMILNATGLQLFPTTVLTLRVAAGSAQPNAILLPTLACTAFSTLVGAGLGLLCYRFRREGRR